MFQVISTDFSSVQKPCWLMILERDAFQYIGGFQNPLWEFILTRQCKRLTLLVLNIAHLLMLFPYFWLCQCYLLEICWWDDDVKWVYQVISPSKLIYSQHHHITWRGYHLIYSHFKGISCEVLSSSLPPRGCHKIRRQLVLPRSGDSAPPPPPGGMTQPSIRRWTDWTDWILGVQLMYHLVI